MNHRLLLPILALLAYPATSHATYHMTAIRQVLGGVTGDATVQFVEIEAYSSGQTQFSGKQLLVFDHTGAQTTVTCDHNLSNSASHMTVLFATSSVKSFFGGTVDPDFTLPPLDRAGGKICFVNPSPSLSYVDCFAWGSYSGAAGSGNAGVGTPYDVANGLPLNQAVIRNVSGGTSPTLLDASDDTNNCANDFAPGMPSPRNNAGVTGTRCGNGSTEAAFGEECDDGNLTNTDACTATCQNAQCGDGIKRTDIAQGNAGYEACDDGNTVDTDSCRNGCILPACGDGIVSVGEQCEPPSTSTCTATCLTINLGCGNGVVTGTEQCDDGNFIDGDGCRSNCTLEVCGDNIKDPQEQCDDGNTVNGDSCHANCTLPACGDGILDLTEDCDDGNTVTGDGCDANCNVEEPVADEPPPGNDPTTTTTNNNSGGCAAVPDIGWFAAIGVMLLAARGAARRAAKRRG